jgi:hypothetical protein
MQQTKNATCFTISKTQQAAEQNEPETRLLTHHHTKLPTISHHTTIYADADSILNQYASDGAISSTNVTSSAANIAPLLLVEEVNSLRS